MIAAVRAFQNNEDKLKQNANVERPKNRNRKSLGLAAMVTVMVQVVVKAKEVAVEAKLVAPKVIPTKTMVRTNGFWSRP